MNKLYTLLLAICGISVFAQSPLDSVAPVDYRRPELWLDLNFGAISNSYSTSDLLKFTTNDFLDEELKGELLPNRPVTRLGYRRSVELGFDQPGYYSLGRYKKGYSFAISNVYYNTATATDDLIALLLFGNQAFENETLNLGQSELESWFYSKLSYGFDIRLDSARPLRVYSNLILAHDHNHYELEELDLFTARNGEYLDVSANYQLQSINTTQALNGMGVSLGAAAQWQVGKGKLSYSIRNLGVVYLSGASEARVDSNFRFRGFSFSNLFDLNDSIFDAKGEELEQSFLQQRSDNYFKITPFSLMAQYQFQTPGAETAYLRAEYIYLTGYIPKATAGLLFDAENQQTVDLSVSVGGFTTAGLNVGYRKEWNDLSLKAEIVNLSSLVVPNLAGGAYGSLRLQYQL